jgi:hypothetical protein
MLPQATQVHQSMPKIPSAPPLPPCSWPRVESHGRSHESLMATMLQQWTRRHCQLTQRNYPPHVRAHIREYFALGADRFHISKLVETLPALLLIPVLLFFSGLVVFALRGNIIVAYVTVAFVAFCVLWYIILTLAPLIFHDCPYQTPLSTPLWFCTQVIQLLSSQLSITW